MKKIIIAFLLFALSFTGFAENIASQDSLVKQQTELKSFGLSDKAIEKLSADQIVKIYKIQQEQKIRPHGNFQGSKQVLVPVLLFFFIALVTSLALFLRYKKSQSLHHIIYKSLETGTPIPLDLLKAESGSKASDLKKGVILTAGGLGLLLVLYIENQAWSIGFVPLFVGIGFLIVDRLDKNAKAKEA